MLSHPEQGVTTFVVCAKVENVQKINVLVLFFSLAVARVPFPARSCQYRTVCYTCSQAPRRGLKMTVQNMGAACVPSPTNGATGLPMSTCRVSNV